MAVERIGRALAAAPPAAPAPSGGAQFSAMLEAPPPARPEAMQAGPASAAAQAAAILAGAMPGPEQDRRARRHGRAVLETLGHVQRAVLRDDAGEARAALGALAQQVSDWPLAHDPALTRALQDIATRAAVVLARARSSQDVAFS